MNIPEYKVTTFHLEREPFSTIGYSITRLSNGFGPYSSTLYAENVMETQLEAERAIRVARAAYKDGYSRAMADIRKLIGAKND